jgi:hypothetical protein
VLVSAVADADSERTLLATIELGRALECLDLALVGLL